MVVHLEQRVMKSEFFGGRWLCWDLIMECVPGLVEHFSGCVEVLKFGFSYMMHAHFAFIHMINDRHRPKVCKPHKCPLKKKGTHMKKLMLF